MNMGRYILAGHEPIPCEDLLTWARWMESGDRRVALDNFKDGSKISTVFLGLEHYGGMLFETTIFGPDGDDIGCARYRTWDEAAAGHAKMLHEFSTVSTQGDKT